jgi:hypothetical protein
MARQAHLQAILSAVDKISPVLRRVNARVGAIRRTFRDVGGASRNLLGGLGVPATLGASAMVYGLGAAAKSAMDYAGALQDAKDNTGMAGRAIQEYGTLFESAGVKQEEFLEVTTKLSKGLAEAGAGKDKSLLGLLTKLRIPLRNAKGELRGVEEVLPDLADAFAKNENPALRARMATELFGRSGGRLIAVLAKGGKSMAEVRAEASRLGAVLSDEATERLDDVGDAFGLLNRQVKVQTAAAFAVAAPAILAATKGLQEWIGSNKEMLQQRIGDFIGKIAASFQAWVESGGIERLANQIDRVVGGIGDFIDSMGGMENVLKALGVLVLIGPVASFFQLGASLVQLGLLLGGPLITLLAALATALGGVQFVMAGMTVTLGAVTMAALPWLIAIGLIAGAAYLIYKNWDKIGPWMKDLWDGIVNTVTGAVDQIIGLIEKLNPLQGLGSALGGFLADTFIPDPTQQQSPLTRAGALQGAGGRMQGTVAVRFENAPPGMRVDAQSNNTPGLALNADVGYRGTGSIG